MILEETFQYFTYWDAIESGLYFIIIGYYFLIFAYFILMKFRTSKKIYWLYFSLVFIFLAAGRLFFIGYYFFIPENMDFTNAEMATTLMLYYRLATFCTWIAISMLCGVLGILLFPPEATTDLNITKSDAQKEPPKKFNFTEQQKLIFRIILIAIPVIIACLVFIFPDELLMDPAIKDEYDVDINLIYFAGIEYPAGRLLLNFVLLPLLVFIIPFLYLYLAWKTFGVLRTSYLLNAIGFILYFAGRIAQGALVFVGAEHTAAILPPMLILASLLIIVLANNMSN